MSPPGAERAPVGGLVRKVAHHDPRTTHHTAAPLSPAVETAEHIERLAKAGVDVVAEVLLHGANEDLLIALGGLLQAIGRHARTVSILCADGRAA